MSAEHTNTHNYSSGFNSSRAVADLAEALDLGLGLVAGVEVGATHSGTQVTARERVREHPAGRRETTVGPSMRELVGTRDGCVVVNGWSVSSSSSAACSA